MKKTARSRLIVAGAALSAVSLLGACSSGGSPAPSGSNDDVAKISIGLFQAPGGAPIFAAISEGIAEKYGIEFDVQWITSSSAGVALVLGGDATTVLTSYPPVIDANRQGIPLDVVKELLYTPEGFMTIEVLPDSDINGLEDLVGKTVAVAGLSSFVDNRLRFALSEAGLDPDGINFVELPYAEMPAALERGTVDAVSVFGVPQAQAQQDLGSRTVFDTGADLFEGASESGFVMTPEFIEANPETVAKFQCVVSEGADLVRDDRDLFVKVVMDAIGATEEDLNNSGAPGFVEGYNPDKVQQNADIMLALGLIDKPFDVSSIMIPQPDDCSKYVVG